MRRRISDQAELAELNRYLLLGLETYLEQFKDQKCVSKNP